MNFWYVIPYLVIISIVAYIEGKAMETQEDKKYGALAMLLTVGLSYMVYLLLKPDSGATLPALFRSDSMFSIHRPSPVASIENLHQA